MRAHHIHTVNHHKQQGAVLLISIVMLLAITMMSVVAIQSATLQEKLSAGSMDQNIAFQAAESALRDAELYVQTSLHSSDAFNSNCSNGLCSPSTTATNVWADISNWKTSSKPIVLGAKTSAAAITGVSTQPRYIIELLPDLPSSAGSSAKLGANTNGTAFRITAMGWGKRAATPIMLQSIYIKM